MICYYLPQIWQYIKKMLQRQWNHSWIHNDVFDTQSYYANILMNENVWYLISYVTFVYKIWSTILHNKGVKKAREKFIKDFFYKTPSEYKMLIHQESCVECNLVVADRCIGLISGSFHTTFLSLRRYFYPYKFTF